LRSTSIILLSLSFIRLFICLSLWLNFFTFVSHLPRALPISLSIVSIDNRFLPKFQVWTDPRRRDNDIRRSVAKRKLGNERVRNAFLYLERIMRNRRIKSRMASWRHTRTRSYARAYKYLPTNTHSRVRDALNMRDALNVSTGDQHCVRLTLSGHQGVRITNWWSFESICLENRYILEIRYTRKRKFP